MRSVFIKMWCKNFTAKNNIKVPVWEIKHIYRKTVLIYDGIRTKAKKLFGTPVMTFWAFRCKYTEEEQNDI